VLGNINVMDRSKLLGEGSIPRLLWAFSLPSIVGMVAQALYYFVDRVFIGQALGDLGIAGITVCFPFMLILMAFGMLIGLGAGALVSIRLGEQNREEAERVLGNAATLLVLAAAVLTCLGLLLMEPLLGIFGASDKVLPYAVDYMRVIVLGTIFQLLGFGLNAVIRAEGNPRIAMLTMLIGVLLNVALAPLFIFGMRWGMHGAALATVSAQAVSAVWVVGYFLRGKSLLRLRPHDMRLVGRLCLNIVAIGSPMFAMQLAAAGIQCLLNHQLRAYGGDTAISAMGIIWSVAMLAFMPIFGINQGAQPIIGYNHGAERFDRVKRALQLAVLAATAVGMAGFVVAMLWPVPIIQLFTKRGSDPALEDLGSHAIRICMCMLPLVGFQVVSSAYFQAVGKPKQAMFLSLSRQVLFLIPAVLILPRLFGLDGVWASLPMADLAASLLTGIWLFWELRHLHRRHAESVRPAIFPACIPPIIE
jgi:putative MATE family efflux protein